MPEPPSLLPASAVKSVTTKSALTPALGACAFIGIPLLTYSLLADGPTSIYAFFAAMVPFTITCLLLLYYGVFKPELLQSESYRLRDKAMTIFGDNARRDKDVGDIIEGEYVVTSEEFTARLEQKP